MSGKGTFAVYVSFLSLQAAIDGSFKDLPDGPAKLFALFKKSDR